MFTKSFEISIHALREEGDRTQCANRTQPTNFYPRPPRGGRLPQVTAPAGGWAISIHALREEGDQCSQSSRLGTKKFLSTPSARRATEGHAVGAVRRTFLSTPSARRATQTASSRDLLWSNFYPRPPRGGRRTQRHLFAVQSHFYPRPPRGGRRPAGSCCRCWMSISIHALREEGDDAEAEFDKLPIISIHALREEGDSKAHKPSRQWSYFYPRPPRGGRHEWYGRIKDAEAISIHALREEGDLANIGEQAILNKISIHALREEGDALKRLKFYDRPYFYPRPPRGGRPCSPRFAKTG